MILKSTQRLTQMDKKMRHIDTWLMEQDKVNWKGVFRALIFKSSTTKNKSQDTISPSWVPQSYVTKMVSPPFSYTEHRRNPNFVTLESTNLFPSWTLIRTWRGDPLSKGSRRRSLEALQRVWEMEQPAKHWQINFLFFIFILCVMLEEFPNLAVWGLLIETLERL